MISTSLKQRIKTLLPGILRDALERLGYTLRSSRYTQASPQTTFELIYRENRWSSTESVSGPGSGKAQAAIFIPSLENCLRELSIRTMLDLPCGDFNWMQEVRLAGIKYTGADLVDDLILKNQANYPQHRFIRLDLLKDQLPAMDLIFNRDCLVHFSFQHIAQALNNIGNSDSTYFMTTSFSGQRLNYDIHSGDWRPLNLQRSPFHFPTPLISIPEYTMENRFNYREKSLCLWEISTLRPAIAQISRKYRT